MEALEEAFETRQAAVTPVVPPCRSQHGNGTRKSKCPWKSSAEKSGVIIPGVLLIGLHGKDGIPNFSCLWMTNRRLSRPRIRFDYQKGRLMDEREQDDSWCYEW